MKRKTILAVAMLLCIADASVAKIRVNKPKKDVAVQTGQYEPDWDNLAAWSCPEWFRDAKFGIWAHWDPQCQAEAGDWYAREMYYPGWKQDWHKSHFGDPKDYGYKELCRDWKADKWNPEELISLYKSAGARYFMAMGNHHDNFDCWDSPYQEWNSMNVGPMRDIVGGWAEMCRKYGLYLGISFHASHTWTWMEPSTKYDGTLTKADGKGQWWEGLDPQELYAQNHPHSSGWENSGSIHGQWAWGGGAAQPSEAYKQKFQNRVLQAIDKYHPSVIYFDDTVLPFWGCDERIGLNILTHYYYTSALEAASGCAEVVVTGKILQDKHKKAMLWDVERGIPDRCQPLPWQTCTCLADWHYERGTYERNGYKSAGQVVRMLVDIVSKNGNLLLSVPVRGNGTIDEHERERVMGIKAWMDINSESIYGTRPWKVYGEGPLFESANPLNAQGFNEGINYSARDVRYVQKQNAAHPDAPATVYATIMEWPAAGAFTFKAFGIMAESYCGKPVSVRLLGSGDVPFTFDENGLTVQVPSQHPNDIAPVFEVDFDAAGAAAESLQLLIDMIERKMVAYATATGFNTGQFTQYALNQLGIQVAAAKRVLSALPAEPSQANNTAAVALSALRAAYKDFCQNGVNVGGALSVTGTDITTNYLVEASNFSSLDASSKRFGTPANWTVENFYVPQTNGNSPKNGIDKNPGYPCLMLGLWAGEDGTSESDLQNARIYRRVTLPAGRYFFGATYNTIYGLSDQAYMFAATATTATASLTSGALAWYPITACASDGKFYGIEFTLDQEQEVLLGWQVDLKQGSNTLEFRVEKVKLVRRKDVTQTALTTLQKKAQSALDKAEGKINANTGYYAAEAVSLLQQSLDECTVPEGASESTIIHAYYTLQTAYDQFTVHGLNAHGVYDLSLGLPEDSRDLTIDVLKEADNFSRTDASTTRFGKPAYWTVEGFQIPNGSDGTKQGLDRYSGADALMLGVWNDRSNNRSGNLANARIYQKVHLDAGRYYFGARFNANYSLNKAYIFAASDLLTTAKIPTSSIAYDNISTCAMDGRYYGIYFTLPQTSDFYLGFQANMASGSETQEFRAEAVCLLALNTSVPVGIGEIKSPVTSAEGWYDLSGRRLPGLRNSNSNNNSARRSMMLINRNGTTRKVLR